MLEGYLQDLVPVPGEVVQYYLELDGGRRLHLNPLLGRHLALEPMGGLACVWCGRKVKKLFPNGSCYPCFRDLPQNDLCVVKPHLCHYDTCRDPSWGDQHCMVPTYVYLARSSDIKVGISRNLPGRWLEQGAVEAVPVALLPTRKLAGELEAYLSQHLPDKTNWRRMLKGEVTDVPLDEVRRRVLDLVPPEFQAYVIADGAIQSFSYPVTATPEAVKSLDLAQGPAAGKLLGIKAQYLILSTGVVNVPRYAGWQVRVRVEGEG